MTVLVVLAVVVMLAVLAAFVTALIANHCAWEENAWRRIREKEREIERLDREAERRKQSPLSALDLYMSTGRTPTGRTAEILRLAQQSHDDQQAMKRARGSG